MSGRYPKILYTEEGMREGMQIEDANIPVSAKVELLDALSETGLKEIVIGSFVSPKYTPQMAHIDEIVTKFHPKPGVQYTALALNPKGVERAKQYSPPLTIAYNPRPQLRVHQCDVFVRRNTNRSQMQEMELWPKVIASAVEKGVKEAGIGTNATFGSNFVGDFSADIGLVPSGEDRGDFQPREAQVAGDQQLQCASAQYPGHGDHHGLCGDQDAGWG
jgi:hydroxymethylglutaryl-CoA lyase